MVIPADRKDDITYLENTLQEVVKCLADKVYSDWKRANKLGEASKFLPQKIEEGKLYE